MAKPFFPQDWESLTVEELATARARLAGFIEAVPDREKILREQLEATQKALLPLQNGILSSVALISKLAAGATKREAEDVLVELRKSEESMRDRLFVLQVWRKYDQETADKLARRKAGEYLDPELAKVLEEREKKMDRERRERERDREKFGNRSKRYRGDSSYRVDFRPSTSDHGTYHTGGRGGFGYGGRGGSVRGGKRPGPELKCHLCGDPGHFFKQCPTKK